MDESNDESFSDSQLSPEQMKKITTTSLQLFEAFGETLVPSLIKAAEEYSLGSGLYFIALIDLSDSTVVASKTETHQNEEWINEFAKLTRRALSNKSTGIYLKTIGDGSLFLFRKFNDIIEWQNNVNTLCKEYNQKITAEGRPDFYQYHNKIIVHLGEVLIDLEKKDAGSFALDICFKIEKKFGKTDLGITEPVRQVILPDINSGKFEITKNEEDYALEGTDIRIPLWKLHVKNIV